MDDPGALILADLRPRHDSVLVRVTRIVACACREGRPNCRQVIERTGVSPADELRAWDLFEDLEWTRECGPDGLLPQPELVIPLADTDVPKRRSDRRSDVRGQRPRRRRPDEQRFARSVDEREPDRQARILAVLVALVHLHLR